MSFVSLILCSVFNEYFDTLHICGLAGWRGFLFYISLPQDRGRGTTKWWMRMMLKSISNPGFNKSTLVSFLVQAQRNLRRVLLCYLVAEKSKIAWRRITILFCRCFARRFHRSPYNSRAGRINCAELLSPKAMALFASPLPSFAYANLASACLNHSNVPRIEILCRQKR